MAGTLSSTMMMATVTEQSSPLRSIPSISYNATWANTSTVSSSSMEDIIATCTIGTILSVMCIIGVTGNIYTLIVMYHCLRYSTSMYIYIINLALADLLYLLTIPFVVGTYFVQEWYFGDIGCRILFSLDFLTMHASIFTLMVMSTERYFAVLKPLDTVKRSKSYRKTIAIVIWIVSLLLTFPMLIMIHLVQGNKKICLPTWSKLSSKIYITILFCTSIVGPGVIIGYLYIKLARTYWVSQTTSFKQTKRLPNQKVLYLIFTIVLVFWACFLPFWIWQLISQYCEHFSISKKALRNINYVTTCLTYSNSCINPFLYTLLTKNYKEYLTNRQRSFNSSNGYFQRRNRFQRISGRSFSSCSQHYTETVVLSPIPAGNDSV